MALFFPAHLTRLCSVIAPVAVCLKADLLAVGLFAVWLK
jgi:hypothetical protein